MLKIHIMDCDAIYGLVDYGYLDSETNGGYAAKMRCRKCGYSRRAECKHCSDNALRLCRTGLPTLDY